MTNGRVKAEYFEFRSCIHSEPTSHACCKVDTLEACPKSYDLLLISSMGLLYAHSSAAVHTMRITADITKENPCLKKRRSYQTLQPCPNLMLDYSQGYCGSGTAFVVEIPWVLGRSHLPVIPQVVFPDISDMVLLA